ncbi:hypothetical protein Bca52824_004521 [Brassica carinata]|uniref:SWR1 complex subunit 6 n=1 Tax=Brassica carinata TaxID=52824 RepID=A0A8X7WP47_BRACI|nr:hypothetical protein Bca52824_004521 [Brassica carinata]
MEEDMANRRVSSRTRKVATKMAAALTSTDNRTQAAIARLEALENDNGAVELVDLNDDEEASLDEEDDLGYVQKKQPKGSKRKTRQAKALEARKAPNYSKAAVGPPSSSSRRHFCTVCGYIAGYSCCLCGMRFVLFVAKTFTRILVVRSLLHKKICKKTSSIDSLFE